MNIPINQKLNVEWTRIVNQRSVTLKHLGSLMGIRNYKAKALYLKTLTKNKQLHEQLNQFIDLYDALIETKGTV